MSNNLFLLLWKQANKKHGLLQKSFVREELEVLTCIECTLSGDDPLVINTPARKVTES